MNIGCGVGAIRAISTLVVTVLLTLALVTPVLGGLLCQLQATVDGGSATIVETGEVVLIEGTGFPSDTDVFITYLVDGTTVVGSETVTTDAMGMFETTVIPQPGEEGLWTVDAEVPKQCTATTTFEVVAAPATASPTPTATPAPTPQGELPDVATSEPSGPSTLILGGVMILAAAAWAFSRTRLARLVR